MKYKKTVIALTLLISGFIPVAYFAEGRQTDKATEQIKDANEVLLNQTVNNIKPTHVYKRPEFRTDLWQWYWNEKAQLKPSDLESAFGNTFIDYWFKEGTDKVFIPAWDATMRYDLVRVLLLIVSAGLLSGASFVCACQLLGKNKATKKAEQ